jgi:tetratricopeptide (TPR) repeat protein
MSLLRFLFVILPLSVGILAQNVPKTPTKKLSATELEDQRLIRLEKILNKEEILIRSLKTLGPKLWWRLIEIQSEKLSLLKRKENNHFLKSSIAGDKKPKKLYFKESRTLARKIAKQARHVVHKWPRYRFVGDIYYTLALNNRDYGDKTKIEYYLNKSLHLSAHSKELRHKVRVALAEYFYNNKKYHKAISFYSKVIRNNDDRWQAKHLYNYSWCLTKKGHYDKAITFAKLSLSTGKRQGFVSVAGQLFNTMGMFFILAKKTNDGVDFYLNELDDATPYLIKMAKKSATDLGYGPAHQIYVRALKDTITKKHHHSTSLIYLEQLDFFRQFKKDQDYWLTAKKVEKHSLAIAMKPEHIERAVNTIKSYTHFLQAHFRNNIERYQASSDNYGRILGFMDILVTLDKINSDFYRFYQAEIYLAVEKNEDALAYYKMAFDCNKTLTLKTKDYPKHLKQRSTIFDSLFYALDSPDLKPKIKDEMTHYSYTNHITLFPKNKRTRAIFPKLFYYFTKKKKYNDGMKTLTLYIKSFPSDQKIQRDLYTAVIDHRIQKSDVVKLVPMILKIESGFLSYSKKYINNALHVLSGLVFKQYENLAKDGRNDEAIKGYEMLYSAKKTPASIKGSAAYKVASLNIEQKKYNLAARWLSLSYPLIPKEDRIKTAPHIQSVVNLLFFEQNFKASAQIASSYAKAHCHYKFPTKNELFTVWLNASLLSKNVKFALKLPKFMKRCGLSKKTINQTIMTVGQHFYQYYSTKTFLSYVKNYSEAKKFYSWASYQLVARYWHHDTKNQKRSKERIANFLKRNALDQALKGTQEEILSFHYQFDSLINTKLIVLKPYSKHKKFKEEAFNKALESNMASIQKTTKDLGPFLSSTNAWIAANAITYMSLYLKRFAHDLVTVTPQGLGKEYQQGFRQAMAGVAKQVRKQERDYSRSLLTVITNNQVLPRSFTSFKKSGVRPIEKITYRHPASLYILPIDHQSKEAK